MSSEEEAMSIPVPDGYVGVEWDEGGSATVHAVDPADRKPGQDLWRVAPACGRAGPGVSSDEAGPDATGKPEVTCWECIAILS